jgi:hypothetical protein
VTNSSADVEILGNRVATYGSLGTTVSTSGALAIVPASNSKEFTDFQTRTAGLTLSEKLGGLQIGRPGDTTANTAMKIQNNWTISGPITVNARYIEIFSDLTTTGAGNSPIRLHATNGIYVAPDIDFLTSGSDVVFWTGVDKVEGVTKTSTPIYIDPRTTIRTNGGKIWLAGGRDDGGADALITDSRGAWSSLSAGDGYPDGYAVGDNQGTWNQMGILINTDSILDSGGGDIFIAGAAAPSGSGGYAHIGVFPGVQIDSGEGRIAMWGRSLGTAVTQGLGLHWDNGGSPVVISSEAETPDAITLYSDSYLAGDWSRGITAAWKSAWNPATGYQGVRILATGSGGGISLTGIGSATGDNPTGAHGLFLDFIDILALDGPIEINGDSGTSLLAAGVAFGPNNLTDATVRLGAWTPGSTGAIGGNSVTTISGSTADFATSSSNVTLNTDSVWNRQSGNTMRGVYVGTTGEFKVLPSNLSSGVLQEANSFKKNQNTLDWSFERLQFPISPASIQIGKEETTTPIRIVADLEA